MGRIKVKRAEIILDYLPTAMEWISHPDIEDGQSMQVVTIESADHDAKAVSVGLSTPIPMP